ncbi:thioredoxin-like protein [Rhodocollybia butyracea]|uniref:Thioredoxin-like protein n=1 Tax=Rhodocollybia butyracea TaxID=206335 RepID=A0A9P5UBR7_9AGAR|nr:thioredoxin-like protein [Rhodocollybia butyracea]
MFSSFQRVAHEITIFHYPSSPASQRALNMLRSAVSGPFPAGKASSPPLDFELEVVEAPPTSDQLRTIMSYISGPGQRASAASVFLSAHPSTPYGSEAPQSMSAIHDIGAKNPHALKWPIVVDWAAGKASIGGDVEGILESLRKKRDGELSEEEPKGWFS